MSSLGIESGTMRKSVFTIYKKMLVAFVATVLMLALSPVTAMAADGDAPSAAVADERIAWAKQQTVTKVNTLDAERGGATDASVRYFQKFDSAYTGVARTFEYRLVPIDATNPMPQNSENGIYAWTFTGDGDAGWVNIDFSNVTVSEGEKVFYYVAYQHIPDPQAGYTYDDTVFYVDVHVLANGQGVVANVRNSSITGNKVDDPGWTVKYEKPASEEKETEGSSTKDTGNEAENNSGSSGTQSGTYSSTYTPASTTSSTSSPLSKTGDNTSVIPLMAVAALAAAAFAIAIRVRRVSGGSGRG